MRSKLDVKSAVLLWRRLALIVALSGAPSAFAVMTCPSVWYVSYGGTSSYTVLNTDRDNLPLSSLYFSRSYNDPTDLSRGYLDFNRDGKSDVFSAVPIGGGFYQWRYSSGGSGPWINLGFDSTPPDQLRFGDFDGDGYTDVFSITPKGDGTYQWRYSSGGTASYVNLAYAGFTIDQLRFGDFDGDGKTDVFAVQRDSDGYHWLVSYSGTMSFDEINVQPVGLSEMLFGDFDGNGHDDVFTTFPDGDQYDWFYSPAASGPWTYLATRPQSVHDVVVAGNFDSTADIGLYHGSDIFYALQGDDGTYQWWYFDYKPSPLTENDIPLAYDSTPPANLRFADFNGDGVTDVFKLGPCDRIFGDDFEGTTP